MNKFIFNSNFLYKNINKNIKSFNNRLLTRFAPEASSLLHIGHLKNIFINQEISKIYNGEILIRIDDTNPYKNKKLFIKNIKIIINWLNKNILKKKNFFYTSFYFFKLYQYLEFFFKKKYFYIYNVLLINFKKNINKNLKLLRKIKNGNFKEKLFFIKLKKIKNIFFIKKKILYRILYKKHHKTKYNWFLYPMYDFSNIILDKIQNIKYSICTSEFIKNKKIFKLICDLIYKNIKVFQCEFSRLNIKYNLTSKRKIYLLKKNFFLKNLKDKRLFNIISLKKRGFNKNILNLFCKSTGINKNKNLINPKLLENIFKENIKYYFKKIMIINPIKIKIINLKNIFYKKNIIFSNNIFIEKFILIKKNKKNFFYLKNFNIFLKLKNIYLIKFKNFIKNKFGIINIIKSIYINKKYIKNKFYLKKIILIWISELNINKINIKIFKEFLKNNKKLNIKNINLKSKKIYKVITENLNTKKNKNKIYYNFNKNGYFIIKNFFKISYIFIVNTNSTLHDLNVWPMA